MLKLKRGAVPTLILLAVLAIAGTAFYIIQSRSGPKTGVLEIRDTDTGLVLGTWPLTDNGEFTIAFIHSVNQSPVREVFSVNDGKLRLRSVRFYSFGAGMQSDLDEGHLLSRDGDAMVISGFNVSFREIHYIIGTISNHVLLVNNERVNLWGLADTSDRQNAHITLLYNTEGN